MCTENISLDSEPNRYYDNNRNSQTHGWFVHVYNIKTPWSYMNKTDSWVDVNFNSKDILQYFSELFKDYK